jgi:hypothetical protein
MLSRMRSVNPRARRIALMAGLIVSVMSCGDDETNAPTPTELRFAMPPVDLIAGQVFDMSVVLVGAGSALSSESGRRVSLALENGDRLSGPVSVSTDRGVAFFKDLAITSVGDALRLQATSGSLTATTGPFRVRAAPVSSARSSFFPDSIIFIPGTPTPIEFSFTDAYGNPLAGQPASVTSSLTGTMLNPASGTTNEAGVFATTFTATTGGIAMLAATISGTSVTLGGHLAATEFCAPIQMSVPGSVSGTIPIATCDAVGRPAAVYRFSKSGGGGVAFTAVPSGFTARVEVKTSLTEPSVAIQPTAGIPTAEWLLPDGSYLYRISALSVTASGSYTITSSAISGTTGRTTRFLVAPGTYTGQALSLTDREYGDGTMYDYFVLYSNRRCTITMRSTAFDAVLEMDDAVAEQSFAFDNNSAGGTDARITLNSCSRNGNPVGILANSNLAGNGSTATGAYTLTVEYGPPVPSLVGAPVLVSVRPDTSHHDLSEYMRMKRSAAVRK